MAKDKKSFLLYADLIHTVRKMPKEKISELFLTILEYVNDENPVIDDNYIEVVFEPIKQQLKRDLNKWGEKRERRSEAGRLGGLAKASNAKQKVANLAVSVTDNVNVNENVNEKKEQKEGLVYFPKSSEIETAFHDYLKLRAKNKFTMTDRAINALVKKLREFSGGDVKKALEIIDNAVVGKWKTFYTLDK